MGIPPFLHSARAKIDEQLQQLLAQSSDLPYASLLSAARYSLLAPGKRLRPLLVLAVVESYGIGQDRALIPACALEMVHTYSLIHDDLPCMDDDDLRRGRPTLHKVYPEWHALLTGDFLLTFAFEILSSAPLLDADQKLALVRSLSSHAGAHGMIGGQMIDLLSEGQSIDWDILEQMHRHKTAGLIIAALEFGAIISRAPPDDLQALREAGSSIGIAFQLIDDVLDDIGVEEELGKTVGSDRNKAKVTAVSLLGLEEAKVKADLLLRAAQKSLNALSHPAPLLSALFDQMVNRRR
jgi:geranylgeranyl diphosphate synthase, type II